MREQDLRNLISRYLDGEGTPEEMKLVESWYAQLNIRDEKSSSEEDLIHASALMREALFADASMYIKRRRFYRIAAACIVGLLITFGTTYLFLSSSKTPHHETDILPGGNRAVLTLSNGKNIVLDSIANGQIASQANSNIIKLNNGQIAYNKNTDESQKTKLSYNTLSVPRGGEFKIVLPDGTKVWINSESVLKYPVSFDGQKNREVYLTGEAYFEVAHDKNHPFFVTSDKQTAQVLGTHFDINAYPDNISIKTTLLEGSLKIKSLISPDSCKLIPGKQAILSRQLKIQDVDVDDVTDWIQGYFIFNKEPLDDILKRLSKWYNVNISYKGDIKEVRLDGIVGRNTPLSEVLNILSATGKVHFQIKDRVIYAAN